MIRTTLTALAILAIAPLAGCEFSNPWGSQIPAMDDAFNDQSCGRTLTGEIDWHEIDAADLPTLWTELCKTSWSVTGTLVTDYEDMNCISCRCEYASTMVLEDDGCGWYDGATEFEVTVAFAPTASGPDEHVDEAAEWPWLGYMDFEPDWSHGVPEPSGSTSLVYLGQNSEDALSASFDAAEIYLSSVSYVFAENGSDYVDNYARFGISR
jgi:hypothetical protein